MTNLSRSCLVSLSLCLAVLASHAMRAQQAGPASQPVGPTGTIAGRVINAATGAPVAGLEIEIVSEVEAYRDATYGAVRHQVQNVVSAMTGADGRYATKALPVGDYYVRAPNINRFGLIGQIYDKVTYWGTFSFPTRGAAVAAPIQGAAVTVNANRVTSGIDFALEPGGAITGTVRNAATGERVPRAKVTVGQAGPGVETVADADGFYRVTGLSSGSYTVMAEASEPGLLRALYPANSTSSRGPAQEPVATVVVNAPAVTAGIDIALQPGGATTGRVTDQATGAPIPGVTVTAGRGTGTTDANGDYVVRGLPTDSFEVFARAPSSSGYIDQLYDGVRCRSQGCDLKLGTKVRVTAPETTARIDFRLQRGAQISGRVTNATTGAPVAGVSVSFYPVAGGPLSTSSTDSQGRYVSAGLLPGPTYVYTDGYNRAGMLGQVYPGKPIESQQEAFRSGMPVTAVEGSAVGGIDFAFVQGGVITGTVVNARTGEPVVGIPVSANGERAGGRGRTDLRGRYEIKRLSVGSYALFASSDLWINTQPPLRVIGQVYQGPSCWKLSCPQGAGTPVSVAAGRTTPKIDFSLADGGVIAGVVTNAATRKPVAGARVLFYSSTGDQIDWVRTDANGRYASGGLPSGTYLAVASVEAQQEALVPQVYMGRSFAPTTNWWTHDSKGGTPIAVTAPSTTSGIDFALSAGGTISGIVTIASTGTPVPGARVNVHTAPKGAESAAHATTDAGGRYQVSGLADGRYYVQVEPPETKDDFDRVRPKFPGLLDQVYPGVGCSRYRCYEALLKGTPVAVGAGAPATGIDFRLRAGGTVSGRVTATSSGEPVRNVLVSFHSASGVVACTATTDFQGNYTASPVPPGSYYMRTQLLGDAPVVGALYSSVPYWPGNLSVKAGTPVAVEEGGAATGKDFALAPGGVIQGKVTWADSGKPAQYFAIRVYTPEGVLAAKDNIWARAATGDGAYTVTALPPGRYFVMTAEGEAHGYVDQVYRGVMCPREACRPTAGTPVIISGPGVVSGIDFGLRPGPARDTTSGRLNLRPGRVWVEPGSGPASGGSLVTISGGPFDDWGTTVLIGGVAAVSVDWRNLTSLKVVVPPGKPGPADIVVTTPGGSVVLLKGYTYVAGQAAAPARRR